MGALERTYLDLSRPIRDFRFRVDAVEAGSRLDRLLRSHYPWKSRAHYQRMLARGDVLVDGRPAKASTRVREGAEVVVRLPPDPRAPERETAEDLVFLYEDEHVAAVDKPSGMACHPVGRIRHGTLINKLHAHYRHEEKGRDVVPRLGHRLDRDTSGVVLLVKSREADRRVTEAFSRRRVRKRYLALVRGVPHPVSGVVDAPMARDPDGDTQLHQGVVSDGLPARSRWRVLESFRRHALLELEPLTGRTHQLRVHMAHLGHPILCDHLYGDLRPLLRSHEAPDLPPSEDAVLLERLALHSNALSLDHPMTGEPLRVESPLPEDLARALAALRALGGAGPSREADRGC